MEAMIQPKDEVLELLAEKQDEIVALGVKRLGLFGSFLHGEPQPDSDVDLLVEFEP